MKLRKSLLIMIMIITLIIGISSVCAADSTQLSSHNQNNGPLKEVQTHKLTEDTYENYFDENYNLKDSVNDGDVLDISGTIANKNFTINKAITLTSSNKDANILNGTIRVNGVDGIVITNLNITNGDGEVHPLTRGSGIILNLTTNSVIANNNIIVQQNGVGMGLYRTVNTLIENNTMKTLYYHTSATASASHSVLVLLGANYTNINNNIVLSEGSNSIYASPWSTADLPGSGGNSFYTNVTNNYVGCLVNNIMWYQGITIIGSYSNIINNTVNRSNIGIASGYAATIIGNKLYNVTTGISNSYTATSDGNLIQDNYIENTVRGGTTTGITASTQSKLINNTIIDVTTGISISANQKDILIENNTIKEIGKTTTNGIITAGTGQATNVLVKNNTVNIRGANALSIKGSNITVIDNYLYSSKASGDNAANVTDGNIVENNTPPKHLGFIADNHNVVFTLTYDNEATVGTITYTIKNSAGTKVKSGSSSTSADGTLTVNIDSIPIGDYNIEASYEDLTLDDSFTKKYDTFITTTNITCKYGETVYVEVNVTDANGNPVNGGTVVMREGGTSYPTANVVNGTASIRFSGNAWTHNCTLTYSGYEYYNQTFGEITIDVEKMGLILTVPNVVTKPDTEINYTIKVRDENGEDISYVGYFYVQIDGENLTDDSGNVKYFTISYVSQSNSSFQFTIKAPSTEGTHTVTALFPYGSSYYSNGANYLESEGNGSLIVTDKTIANIYYNTTGPDYYYIVGKVFENKTYTLRGEYNSNGRPYSGYSLTTNMTLTIDTEDYQVPIQWGDGKFNVSGLKTGNYTLTGLISTDTYQSKVTVGRLEVFKYTTEVNTNVFYGFVGSQVSVPVTVTGEAGKTVESGLVTITIDGKEYSANVKNGIAKVDVLLPNTDNFYEVKIQYTSDNDWFYDSESSTYATAINYPPVPTPTTPDINITISEVSGNGGETVYIPITINTNSQPATDGEVIVKLDGKLYVASVANGEASVEVNLPNTIGAYPIKAVYTNGEETGTGIGVAIVNNETPIPPVDENITTTVTLNVEKTTTGVILTGTLLDKDNNPISDTVYITLKNKDTSEEQTYNTNTGNDGKYSLTLNQLTGTYTAQTTYQGNDKYLSSSSTIKNMNMDSNDTIIDTPEVVGKYGDNNNFTGTILDDEGNPIVGYHISLNLTRVSSGASKVYTVISDYKGEYVLPINLAPGEYTVVSTINDQGYTGYSSSTITIKASDEDLEPTSISYGDYNIAYNSGSSFTSKIFSNYGYGLGGQHVAITLSNARGQSKTYDIVSDYEGNFELPINLGRGTYTVVCSYAGTSTYQSSSSTSTITVY